MESTPWVHASPPSFHPERWRPCPRCGAYRSCGSCQGHRVLVADPLGLARPLRRCGKQATPSGTQHVLKSSPTPRCSQFGSHFANHIGGRAWSGVAPSRPNLWQLGEFVPSWPLRSEVRHLSPISARLGLIWANHDPKAAKLSRSCPNVGRTRAYVHLLSNASETRGFPDLAKLARYNF